MEFTSKSEKDTFELAARIGQGLKPGDILALYGDLGSGKTAFTKGLAKFLGIEKSVTSPTFVLMKNYRITNYELGIRELIHIDAYRMESETDAETIGLIEYFSRGDVITVIEWPERIEGVLPERTKRFDFKYLDEGTRLIRYKI